MQDRVSYGGSCLNLGRLGLCGAVPDFTCELMTKVVSCVRRLLYYPTADYGRRFTFSHNTEGRVSNWQVTCVRRSPGVASLSL